MTLKQRIDAFAKLGNFLRRHFEGGARPAETHLHAGLEDVIVLAGTYNNWFIPQFVNEMLRNISEQLQVNGLTGFVKNVPAIQPRTVAVVCAGNIPMVGFHDILCILLSGHNALIKLSGDDNVLIPFFLRLLVHYEPEFERSIFFADGKLGHFDAVIATGSNNTAAHFEYYFGKYPRIIRRNRSSLAVLSGTETSEELSALGKDIFLYFGLGCRNVSKLIVPAGYDFRHFFESIVEYGFVVNNKKYGNNYDYHRALYLLEKIPFLDNNFLMLRESDHLHSPVATLFYQQIQSSAEAEAILKKHENEIQCVIGKGHTPFGYSQNPVISDFADNVDTLGFLVNL